jgi:hypothetical protein
MSPEPTEQTEAERAEDTCLTCSHPMALHNPLGICRQLLIRTPRDRTGKACCCVTEETAKKLAVAFKEPPELQIARTTTSEETR